jgi:hypothetical protein
LPSKNAGSAASGRKVVVIPTIPSHLQGSQYSKY